MSSHTNRMVARTVKAYRRFAEGGEVTTDDMIAKARAQLAAQPRGKSQPVSGPFDSLASGARRAAKVAGFAEGGTPDKPAFDPTKPFEPVAAAPAADAKPAFDPGKPFEPVAAPAATAPAELPDVGAPAISAGSGQLSSGTDWGNNLAEGAAKTANTALQNAPQSAGQFASNMVQPIIHPVDTAESLKNLGMGILEKAGVTSGDEHVKYADAVGKFFADRYGGLDRARKTLEEDPVGMLGDLSMVLTGGGSAAARLPGVAGRAGEVAGTVGRGLDPVRAAAVPARVAASTAGNVASEIAGVTSGAGGQALRTATEAGAEGGQAGRVFRDAMTGRSPLEDAVNEARGAVAQLRHERGQDYRAGMGPVRGDPAVLNFNQIDTAVANAQGVKTYRGRSGTGPEQSLSPRTEGIRTEMENAIEHWRGLDPAEFHSAEGIDALKQQLGDIRDATMPHTPERVAADRIYNAVRQTIVDQVPGYARVMRGYETASNQIREIEQTLSLKPNANIDTALRKLQSGLRDNVNTSFGRRTELIDMLTRSGAPHLMERLAGQTLRSWTPRGLGRFVAAADVPAIGAALAAGAPAAAAGAAAAIPMMSPRLMGNAAYGIGAAQRYGRNFSAVPRYARQVGQISPYGEGSPSPYQ